MKFNFEETKIYVRPGATDLRKGVGGLLAVIENEMKLDALTDSVFLFCNKSHKLLKLIFWNKTSFWIAKKRLERNTWPCPDNSGEKYLQFDETPIEIQKQDKGSSPRRILGRFKVPEKER